MLGAINPMDSSWKQELKAKELNQGLILFLLLNQMHFAQGEFSGGEFLNL